MTQSRRIRVGVIGLGFMGATHVRAYFAAATAGFPCELVAVADPKKWRRGGMLDDVGGNIATAGGGESLRAFDPSRVRAFANADELIASHEIDLVSICTRTDSHVPLARAALEAGKHVLVEKPVALRAEPIRGLNEIARRAGRICMPGMCMRFWPGWDWLKARIEDRAYGPCLSATFQRLTSPPAWALDFYADGARSGGAIADLHVHDADFVRFCFGDPDAVSGAGRVGDSGAIDHVTTLYRYERGNGPAHVVAEGGWDHAPGFPFTMRYVAIFERATASYDIARGESSLLLCRDGTCEAVKLDPITGYDGEIRHVVTAIAEGRDRTDVTLADAIAVTELLDAERKSAERRDSVPITGFPTRAARVENP
jgi:predicted dehydrogenase